MPSVTRRAPPPRPARRARRPGVRGGPLAARVLPLCALLAAGCRAPSAPLRSVRAVRAAGPLRVLASNPRYFTDGSGRAVYLTGSHTWFNLQDSGPAIPPRDTFDYPAFLAFEVQHNHNFMRLWGWESGAWAPWTRGPWGFAPMPYLRTGPDTALDGLPKYDLTRFDPAYFQRLRERVQAAGERGIYVSVMLFNGFSVEMKADTGGNPWRGHPFNRANNINGVDGDPEHTDQGRDTHTLAIPAITRLQEAYVRRVVDAIDDLDNVLYEISNESHSASTAWQYHMVAYLKGYEAAKPKQHPVGMTAQFPGGDNASLFASPADWVSPNAAGGYLGNPPGGDGRKVVISDTDHECGTCAPVGWVWKSFLRGLNPIFMDPYRQTVDLPEYDPNDPRWEQVRRDMGYTLTYANRMPLAQMTPQGGLASSGYCLAHAADAEPAYLVYLPHGGRVTVDLSATPGALAVEWFSPEEGHVVQAENIAAGGPRTFSAPFRGQAVLYLYRAP